MEPNQLHELDLLYFSDMPIADALRHLDGKVAFIDRLGFDVAYRARSDGAMNLTISDHYRHAPLETFTIPAQFTGSGQVFVSSTYDVINSYIAKEGLHQRPLL